jgi:hypothetical protein
MVVFYSTDLAKSPNTASREQPARKRERELRVASAKGEYSHTTGLFIKRKSHSGQVQEAQCTPHPDTRTFVHVLTTIHVLVTFVTITVIVTITTTIAITGEAPARIFGSKQVQGPV